MHWYLALLVVFALGGVFVAYVAREGRREWLRSGRSAAEYTERLRQNRRRLLPVLALLALVFFLVRLQVIPDQIVRWLPFLWIVLFAPWALHDLWKDRARIAQDRHWRAKALWHGVLLVILFVLTSLVMPVLLSLP